MTATSTAVKITVDDTAAEYQTGRYFGSIEAAHGVVLGISDCTCVECGWMDPWHPDRKFILTVQTDADGRTVVLSHVRNSSFDGWR